MTSRHRRAIAAARALNRTRRPAEHAFYPDAHHPELLRRVDGFVLARYRSGEFGRPTSDEYDVTGPMAAFVDRAQDFEQATIYLDTATGTASVFGWYAYTPLEASAPSGRVAP